MTSAFNEENLDPFANDHANAIRIAEDHYHKFGYSGPERRGSDLVYDVVKTNYNNTIDSIDVTVRIYGRLFLNYVFDRNLDELRVLSVKRDGGVYLQQRHAENPLGLF